MAWMEILLRFFKKIIPRPIFEGLQLFYHWLLAFFAAVFYGFPSRKLKVIGVTGTNGKTTVVHLLSDVLESSGEKVASASSLRFRISGREWKNTLKMTMPGRFKLQKFLRSAAHAGCKYVVLEVTSEGIKQHRHIGINFYMAILTNVTPEHIDSHGGFEKYREAKAELFHRAKIHVLNGEDPSIEYFLKIIAASRVVYTKKDLPPDFHLKLLGAFNIENAVAVYQAAKILGVEREIIKKVLEREEFIAGRLEFVQKEPFAVVVDYAHTPDALRKVYETLSNYKLQNTNHRLICILGAAGGGRDKWKRPELGGIAAEFCNETIITNEDPYDDDPKKIIEEVAKGFDDRLKSFQESWKKSLRAEKILDRREAIRHALEFALSGDTVIITGKGAEPWIMGPNGSKTAWDDREVVRQELERLGK